MIFFFIFTILIVHAYCSTMPKKEQKMIKINMLIQKLHNFNYQFYLMPFIVLNCRVYSTEETTCFFIWVKIIVYCCLMVSLKLSHEKLCNTKCNSNEKNLFCREYFYSMPGITKRRTYPLFILFFLISMTTSNVSVKSLDYSNGLYVSNEPTRHVCRA